MNLAWEYFKELLWSLARLLFIAVRNIGWVFTCVHYRRSRARRAGAYDKTAHVQSILFRHCLDFVLTPSTEKLFITVHNSFQNPDYVLNKNVTLFTVNTRNAVFVETDPSADALNSDNGAFMRIAQFRLAKKIITLPIAVFHQLCEKLPDPSDKIIFANNCARCGSTLLTQVFELTGKVLAMSEPDALNALTQLKGKRPVDDNYDRIIKNTIRMLCKPIDRQIQAYILKPTQPTMIATPTLYRLYPKAKHIFMYREGLPCIKSLDKIGHAMPILQSIYLFGQLSSKATVFFVRMAGLPPDAVAHKVQSRAHFSTVIWASAIRMYLDFLKDGIPIKAVKYEDMVADKLYAFKQIFDFIGMEFDPEAVEKAFNRDSQRGSPLSREAVKKHRLEEITPKVQVFVDEACDFFKVPRIPQPFDVPETITKNPQKAPEEIAQIHVENETPQNDVCKPHVPGGLQKSTGTSAEPTKDDVSDGKTSNFAEDTAKHVSDVTNVAEHAQNSVVDGGNPNTDARGDVITVNHQ